MRTFTPFRGFCAILAILLGSFVLLMVVVGVPPPEPMTGGNLAALSVPSGLTVRHDGCSPTQGCTIWNNYYDAGSHTIVLQPGEGYAKEVHERLHAHQHMSINGGAPLAPSDYDLGNWYGSAEGQSFMVEVGVPDILWASGNCPAQQNGIEAFACVGQLWYNDPTTLNNICKPCYRWAEKRLS